MFTTAHGKAWFDSRTRKRILELMKFQRSAMRSAYQAIHVHDLSGNDVRDYVKRNYMKDLNQRYINDAVSQALQISDEGVIFGGKRTWKQYQKGNITKQKWLSQRNDQLYSRGDRSKQGNPNIRIDGDRILVNDPSKRGKWIEGKIFIPDKFNPDWDCYSVQVLLRDDEFEVRIQWDKDLPDKIDADGQGTIGLDVNPDGVALAETDEHGNLLKHEWLGGQRLPFAQFSKRDYDIFQVAKEVIQYAKECEKPLILEDLKFTQKKGHRKFNRMRSNFVYRKLLNAIERKAKKQGIPVRKVNPAFTSILGNLKYKSMYSLNRHTAAALTIARRGIGIRERKTFAVVQTGSDKEKLNLEGRDFSCTLTPKAYSFLQNCFLKEKPANLTGSALDPGVTPGTRASSGETPGGESVPITSQDRENRSDFLRVMKGTLQAFRSVN